jgi:hypothetical protein
MRPSKSSREGITYLTGFIVPTLHLFVGIFCLESNAELVQTVEEKLLAGVELLSTEHVPCLDLQQQRLVMG